MQAHGDSGFERSPDQSNPLYLSIRENKIIALAANRGLGQAYQQACHTVQKGFIADRNMAGNILNLESNILGWWCQEGAPDSGFAFFDVRAAIPSSTIIFGGFFGKLEFLVTSGTF
eukprot:705220-Pyramimonas_sp.AAC.1